MAELLTHLTRLHEGPRYYGTGLYRQLYRKNIFLWSQAIAFKVLVAVIPLVILATGVLGVILERATIFATVAAYVQNFFPADQHQQVLVFLARLTRAGGTLTIIGVLALLFSGLTLMTTLRVVVGNVFQEQWHEERSLLGGYGFDLRMVGQVGLLFLLTLGLTVAVQRLDKAGFDVIEGTGFGFLWTGVFKIVAVLLPLLITVVMFFQLFYFVPKPHPPKRSAFFGAMTSAVLWEGAKFAFTLYAQRVGNFDRYSGEGTGDPLGSTIVLIIAFVFWVYYSGIVLCLGAVMGLLHEKRHRNRRQAALAEATKAEPDAAETRPDPDDIRTPSGTPAPSQANNHAAGTDATGETHGQDPAAQKDLSVN